MSELPDGWSDVKQRELPEGWKFLTPGASEEEPSVGDYVIDSAQELGRQALNLPGSAIKGVTALGAGIAGVDPQTNPIAKPLYQTGQVFSDVADTLFPPDPATINSLPVQIAGGLGQVLAQIGTAYLTGGTSLLAQGAVAGATGIGMGVDEAYQDALRHAATPEQAREAIGWGALSGSTEFVPVLRTLNRFGKEVKNGAIAALVQGGIGGLEEALQEMAQQGILNFGAGKEGGYDEGRSIVEDLKQSGEVGGAVGFIANALITAITGKRVRGETAPPLTSSQADPEVTNPETASPVDPEEVVLNPVDDGGEVLPEDEAQEPPAEFIGPVQPDYVVNEGPGWDAARAEAGLNGKVEEEGTEPIPLSPIVPVGDKNEPLPKRLRYETGSTLEETLYNQLKASVFSTKNSDMRLADAAMQIIRARAESARESIDQYIFRRGLAVNVGGFDRTAGVVRNQVKPKANDFREHPAAYPGNIIDKIGSILNSLDVSNVLDIFGGIGRIGKIKETGFTGTVMANELEPQWRGKDTKALHAANGVDISTIGDSRNLPLEDGSIDAIATSPTYGNLMGAQSPSRDDTYKAFAGELSEGNTGGLVWGPEYEQLHKEIYKEASRVVKDGGHFILNMKDFPSRAKNSWIPKKGSAVNVVDQIVQTTEWHSNELQKLGFTPQKRYIIPEGRAINSSHKRDRAKTVGYEDIIVFNKTGKVGDIPLSKIPAEDMRVRKQGKGVVTSGSLSSYSVDNEAFNVISLFESQDASTIFHELMHLFSEDLGPADLAIVNKYLGYAPDTPVSSWEMNVEGKGDELLARTFERYLYSGKAPVNAPGLKKVFEIIKKAIRNVYMILKDSPLPFDLDPSMVKLFDRLLTPGGMPTKLQQHEMTYATWKEVHGNGIAASYGVSDTSYAIKNAAPGSRLLRNLRKNIFYATKTQASTQLALMEKADFLNQSKVSPDEIFFRILQVVSTRANISFADRSSVAEFISAAEELKGRAVNREQKNSAESLLSYLKEQERYIEMHRDARTPLRDSLLALQEEMSAEEGAPVSLYVHRNNGVIYRVARENKYGKVLTDLSGIAAIRIKNGRDQTDFFSIDQLDKKGSFTMTKEDFLLQKHADMVVSAIEDGKAVPSFVIAPHVSRDIYFQRAYDFAIKQEEPRRKIIEQRIIVRDQRQDLYDTETPSVEPITQVNKEVIEAQNHPTGLKKRILVMAGMTDESFRLLERLSNVLDKGGKVRFDEIISKVELQNLSGLRGDVGTATIRDYIANIFHELDEIKEQLETKKIDVSDNDKVAMSYERVNTLYTTIKKWHDKVEDEGHGDMLEPGKTDSTLNKLWNWAEREVPIIPESAGSNSIAMMLRKATMTMHWMSRRFPILRDLYRLGSTVRFTQATLMTNSILNGGSQAEVIEYTDLQGNLQKREVRQPGLRTFTGIDSRSGAYTALKLLLLQGDENQKRYSPEEVRETISTVNSSVGFKTPSGNVRLSISEIDAVIKGYIEVQDTLEWMYFKLHQLLEKQFGSGRAGRVMRQLYPKGYIPGYFPHSRRGKYGVVVKDAEGKTTYFGMYERAVDQKRALARLRAKNPGQYVGPVDPNDKIQYQYGGGVDLITSIKEVIAKADIAAVTGDSVTTRAVEQALDDATAAIIKSHGMFSAFGSRQDIPGFDDRIQKVMQERVRDYGAALAKVEFAKNGTEELTKIRSNPSLYNYAQEWFSSMLQSGDLVDNYTGKIRQLIFLKYLGFNVKTAMVVFADKITNAPSRLGLYTKGAEKKLIKSMVETRKFMKWFSEVNKLANTEGILREEAIKRIPIPEGFNEETINAMVWSLDSGTSTAKFVPEIMEREATSWEIGNEDRTTKYGKYMDLASIGMDKVFNWSSWMLVNVETFNRLSTFHAAYEVFRKEKRHDYDRAILNAEDVVNDAHFLYGKPNIPNLFNKKGIGKWLRVFYTFRAFEHNYVQMLGDLAQGRGTEGKKAAAKSLFYLAALGGVPALPFFMVLSKALGAISGDDPEQEVLSTLHKMGASELAGEMFSDGLPGLLGTTFRGSLQVGAYDTWGELIAGVAGSTASDIVASGKAIAHGDWDSFARKALPTVAGNLYKAAQGREHGVLSSYGTPLREGLIGKQIKYTDGELIQKVFSFNPTREAKAYRLKKAITVEDKYWADRRQNIYTKFSKAVRTGDKAGVSAAAQDIISYERDRLGRRAFDIPAISRQSLRSSLSESGLRQREILQVLRTTGRLHGI